MTSPRPSLTAGLLLAFAAFSSACSSNDPACCSDEPIEPKERDPLDLWIDDFEDGDSQPLTGGGWYDYNDAPDGGASTITISQSESGLISMTGEGYESERSLEVEFEFDQASLSFEPYIGFGAWLADAIAPLDLTSYAGISYTYKGAAHTLRLETYDVADYDYYGVRVAASVGWRTVEFPFRALVQEGWGTSVELDPSNVGAMSFQARGATGVSGTILIDDLHVVHEVEDTGPDMPILEPEPPDDESIDSVAIDNPLQELAMEHLSKGFNITNWLEQDRFEDFVHDEDFVAALADAGFQSLRLPIDLDLYIDERSGSGDELELTLSDDLFDILDSFDAWTADYGLSLSIDYHQYDASFDASDEDSVAEAIALWGMVAEHFADSPREDLFYELLNEPELSSSVAPNQEQWTDIAERMIAAIREHDTTRSIIFGDVEWYGIGPLSEREPLSDDNIIYAFHYYDPLLFTHQGADWVAMGGSHDIPYPYSTDRWSEYYLDFGFSSSTSPWVLGQLLDYYRVGNRSAIRNRIIQAKRWAVDNNVPVICNEFGVYDLKSRLEDRVRYYTDIIDIFAELEIPWTHWFMILEDDGSVIPEYTEAFQLE